MALKSGTYVIMSAGAVGAGTNLALDVRGGSDDTNGRTVWLHARNDTDAQLVRFQPWSKSSKYWRLQFLLSDKSLDRDDNGTAAGTAVQQWDSKAVEAQKWDVVADGKTVTYGGKSYDTYTIGHASSSAGTVLDVESATYEAGTQCRMWTANKTDAQRWFMVPQEPISDGTYSIVTALDSGQRLDVAGGSTASGANVQVHASNGTNAQCFTVKTTSAGECKICNSASGLALDKEGGSDQPSNFNVRQWRDNGTEAQRWVIEPAEDYMDVNGCRVPLYFIHAHVLTGYVLDKEGGTDQKSNTNVQVHVKNDTDAQKWAFRRAEWLDEDLPVPSAGGFSTTYGGTRSTSKATGAAGTLSVYVSWKCGGSAEAFQVRYRMNSKLANGKMAGWNDWRSIRDGSTSNGGWGNVQQSNVTGQVEEVDGWWQCKLPIAAKLASSSIGSQQSDRVDMEVQVRTFAAKDGDMDAPAHGNSATFKCRAMLAPSVKVTAVRLAEKGVQVSYTTGLPHSGNSLRLSGAWLAQPVSLSNRAASGTVTVPYSKVAKPHPASGDTVSTKLAVTSADGAWGSVTASTKVTYASGHVALSPTVTASGTKATCKVTSGTSLWLKVERGHGSKVVSLGAVGSSGSLSFLPPLDVSYRLTGTLSGSSWGSFGGTYGPVSSDGAWYVSTLDGAATLPVRVDVGQAPELSMSYKRDSSAHVMTGAERPVVTAGAEVEASFTLRGSLVDGLGKTIEQWDALVDRIAHEAFVLVRGPRGFWAQCALDSTSETRQYGHHIEVSLGLTEVDL